MPGSGWQYVHSNTRQSPACCLLIAACLLLHGLLVQEPEKTAHVRADQVGLHYLFFECSWCWLLAIRYSCVHLSRVDSSSDNFQKVHCVWGLLRRLLLLCQPLLSRHNHRLIEAIHQRHAGGYLDVFDIGCFDVVEMHHETTDGVAVANEQQVAPRLK